ncbi:MAG: polyprenyl synthetase family protein, partial [Candidatus Thermoplasmatota archaeon]|nr:polyprenyl synthetase family protein [Candidatus Thermoplasmatota archaeon]
MQAIPEAQLLRLEDLREKVNMALEALIQRELDNGAGEVAKLSGEILLSGGKRLRPLLGIFCYEVAGGEDLDEIMDLALAFELIHTATLIHDDINDSAKLRRGVTTLHERIGQPKAIIAGDWLFVQGYGLSGRYTKACIDLIREACANIAVSEFKQLDHVLDLSTSPEDYLHIVQGKTAGPFAAVCES